MAPDMDHNYPCYLPPANIKGRPIDGGPGAHRPDYATQSPGAPLLPGNSGPQPTERVRVRFLDLVYETWLPFTAGIIARFIGPRRPTANWQSPFDLDAGERITRFGSFPSGERPFPYPYMIGAIAGFMPMLDQFSLSTAWGKTPSGPGVNTPIPIPWATTYPDLMKVTG
jgi:hypothetical protein